MQIGVGLSLPLLATRRSGGFSPRSLFTSGVAGAWYDPSDYSTLFQDSAGTTPVTAVEQPVRLMLDKSQGLVLGSELVTNGDFASGSTGWTLGTGWSISGGAAVATAVASGASLESTGQCVSGQWYRATVTVTAHTAGGFSFAVSGNAAGQVYNAAGTYTQYFLAPATGFIQLIRRGSDFTGSVDNISVKAVAGNHALAPNDLSRPVLRARYNQLTYSEQFDNAAWSKNAGAVTVTADTTGTTDPLGGNTADKIVETATTTNHRLTYNVVTNLVAGTTYQFSVYAKAAERQNIVALCVIGGGYIAQNFNVSTGTIQSVQTVGTTVTAGTPTITAIGNGWYRCVLVINCVTSGSATLGWDINQDNTTSTSYLGDITKGIYLWGADLRTGSSAGTYQRIAAATDYATAGFLPYLFADGVDDSMVIPVAAISGATAMTEMHGTWKPAGVATGPGAVFGGTGTALTNDHEPFTDGNLYYGFASTTRETFGSMGTVTVPYLIDSTQTGTTLAVYKSGSQLSTTKTTSIGIGTTPRLFLSNNATNYFYAGNLFGGVLIQKVLSASEMASLRSWMAAKSGVTL